MSAHFFRENPAILGHWPLFPLVLLGRALATLVIDGLSLEPKHVLRQLEPDESDLVWLGQSHANRNHL